MIKAQTEYILSQFAPTVYRIIKQFKGAVTKKSAEVYGNAHSMSILSEMILNMQKYGNTLTITL